MAKQAKSKDDSPRRERGAKRAPRKERTENAQKRHTRNQVRQAEMALRPDSQVSANCLKKREKRDRARAVKKNGISNSTFGTVAGQRQFGENAKGYHIQQKMLGLKRALTPAYVAQLKSEGHVFSNATLIGAGLRPNPETKIKQRKKDRQDAADDAFMQHAATGE